MPIAPSCKFVGAKQGGPLPPDFAGMHPPPGYTGEPLIDAHKILQQHDWAWYGEKTAIHAEVMIIRVWLLDIADTTLQGLSRLHSTSVIVASQPACWCCAKLMKKNGITYPSNEGSKPRTGWRHPLAQRAVPNADLPSSPKDVNSAFLERAMHYKGVF